MDFELSDEQTMLREASRDLLTDRAPVGVLRAQLDADTEVDPTLWRLAGELGWPSLLVPEEYGGAGQGLVEQALVAEEIGRAIARGPFLPTTVVARAVALDGSDELRAETLPPLAAGSAWATWAFAEPGRPWTVEGLGTTARRDGDDIVLSGTKTAVQDTRARSRLTQPISEDDESPVPGTERGRLQGVRLRDPETRSTRHDARPTWENA
jgi:alkylation response protein AidB-like acyl-CoA dehydrogenase